MSTGINSQWATFRATNSIAQYQNKVAANVGRLSTGSRFNSAADDPAAMAFTQRLRGNVGSLEQVDMNMQNSATGLKVADSAYSTAIEIVQKMREIVAGATDPMLDDADAKVAGSELTVLDGQLSNLKSSATYNGKTILGAASGFKFEFGGDTKQTLTIAANDLKGSKLSKTSVTLSKAGSAAAAKLSTLTTRINELTAEQAKIGAWEEALGYMSEFVANKTAIHQEAESNVGDVNIAKEMAAYVKNSVSLQAGQLILSQYNQNAYSVLNMLQ